MAASSILWEAADPQVKSHLLLAPLEIRQAIYALLVEDGVHLFLRQGQVSLSPCVGAILDTRHSAERATTGDEDSDTVWARRLDSSWGTHWKCQEAALATEQHPCNEATRALKTNLLICKRM